MKSAWLLPFVFTICACSTPAPRAPVEVERPKVVAESRSEVGQKIVSIASQYLGSPYKYGGASPSGFDCSGLVYYVHREAGIRVPRTSEQQFDRISKSRTTAPQTGDVVFFVIDQQVSHVGILVDQRRFIHAPKSGGAVEYASLDMPYWRSRLVGAGPLYK